MPFVSAEDVQRLYSADAEQLVLTEDISRKLATQFYGPMKEGKALGGLLLHGPAGYGKTSIARLVAVKAGASLIEIQPGKIFSKFHGESEQLILWCLQKARAHAPCVIMVDEIDGMFPEDASQAVRSAVTQFQLATEPSDMTRAKIIVIGTTNYLRRIPEAIRSRLPMKLQIPAPSDDVVQQVVCAALPKGHTLTPEQVGSFAHEFRSSLRHLRAVVLVATNNARYDGCQLSLDHLKQAVRDLGNDETTVHDDTAELSSVQVTAGAMTATSTAAPETREAPSTVTGAASTVVTTEKGRGDWSLERVLQAFPKPTSPADMVQALAKIKAEVRRINGKSLSGKVSSDHHRETLEYAHDDWKRQADWLTATVSTAREILKAKSDKFHAHKQRDDEIDGEATAGADDAFLRKYAREPPIKVYDNKREREEEDQMDRIDTDQDFV